MNFKKNWKRFFTVSRASEGFTLVELIVVIAILAILAGIAVPAYSGYIKKANKAADLQLLGAVNTAFAASVLENGDDVNEVPTASMTLTGPDGAKSISVSSIQPARYQGGFERYFAGNNSATFKVIAQLAYQNGVFVDASEAEGYTPYTYNGNTVYLSQEDIAALNNSSWRIAGPDGIQNQMTTVTGVASTLIGGSNAFDQVVSSVDYLQYLAASMGVENATSLNSAEALEAAMAERAVALWGEENANQYFENAMVNGAVLYAAQNTNSMTSSDVTTLLSDGDAASIIRGNLATNPGTALAQAAVAYGVYSSYCYASNNGVNPAELDPLEVMSSLNDSDFLDYVNNTGAWENSTTSTEDINGYLSALNMINTSANASSGASINILASGFGSDNEQMSQLLAGMMTTNNTNG